MTDDEVTLEGLTADPSDPERLREALEHAFHYRGDVTIRCRWRAEPIEGYVYDRLVRPAMSDSKLRIMPADGSPRVTVAYSDITEIRFTGRDTAAGKSFESWMKKYVSKKLAGEEASIASEPLEDA